MKRHGNLWKEIVRYDNLVRAANEAQRGKRWRENVLAFNYDREANLWEMKRELDRKTFRPGEYRTFEIFEPKRRLISAAPYRDRVVHHALCNVIVPLFEARFIHDSYANRLGKGTHRALERFTGWLRSSRYILQCDIRKYFPSIDHGILKGEIRRTIKCPDTLWLADLIIDSSNEQEHVDDRFAGDDLLTPVLRRKGLPIGNLTSQFFANVYLDRFDHWVKETLRVRHYVRYVDDFALFSDDADELAQAHTRIEHFLDSLRLRVHPVKTQIFECRHGASFLGFRILPHTIRVRSENLRRAHRRLKRLQTDFASGRMGLGDVSQSIQSWCAHLDYGDTVRLRKKIFSSLVFARG